MKLLKLEISTFKNLRDFSIDFSQTLTTVLLGQNGTGKSNLLEALIVIFRDLAAYLLHFLTMLLGGLKHLSPYAEAPELF